MWSWLPAAVSALLTIIKGLFGIDKPQQRTINETPSSLPPPAPADVLRDLGITPDATGTTGGAFSTRPDPHADTIRLHAGSNGGSAARADSPRSTAEDFGERVSQR